MNQIPLPPSRTFRGRHIVLAVVVSFLVAFIGYRTFSYQRPQPPPPSEPGRAAGVRDHTVEVPRIGILLSADESFKAAGDMFRMGAEVAAKERAFQVPKIELAFFETENRPSAAADRVRALVSDPDTIVVVEYLPLAVFSAVAPLIEKEDLLTIVPASSHQALTGRPSVLPLTPSDRTEAAFAASALRASGDTNIAVLFEPGPYGTLLLEGFREQAEKDGMPFKSFSLGAEQIRSNPLPDGANGQEASVVFLAGLPEWALSASKSLMLNGYKGRFLFPRSCEKVFLDENYLTVPETFTFVRSGTATEGEAARNFRDSFVRDCRREPERMAFVGYDCVQWIADALRQSPPSRKTIRARLLAIAAKDHPYQGRAGSFYFDEKGSFYGGLEIMAYRDGRFVPIQAEAAH